MEQVLSWIFSAISFLISSMMSWKIIGDFSLFHFVLGSIFITALIKFLTFGFKHSRRGDSDE